MRVVCESAEKRVQDAYERGYHDGVKKVSGSSVLTVPLFQFPPFEVWYQNDCKWSGKIGEYYCEVHPTSWSMSGDETRYGCGIATSHVPLNIYVEPIARYNFFWDHQSIDDLREAYEKATSEVNAKWVRHIKEHYLSSSNESTTKEECEE